MVAALVATATRIPGRDYLLRWFAENMPNVEVEPLGPSGESGALEGGCDEFLRVAFDPQSLARYASTWEYEDGSSRDPRWTCWLFSIADWRKQQTSKPN